MPDPVLLPRLLPSAISHHVGDRSAGRGLARARGGRVEDLVWDGESSTVTADVTDDGGTVQHARVLLEEYADDSVSRRFLPSAPGGLWRPRGSQCSCPSEGSCEHVAALLYRLNDLGDRAEKSAPPAEWRSVLRPLLAGTSSRTGAPATAPRPLAIRFDLEAGTGGAGASRQNREPATAADLDSDADLWLGVRPLTRGRKGTWIKGELSWRTFEGRLGGREYDAVQSEALTRVFASASAERSYSSGAIDHLWLNTITSPLLWQSLVHARDAGVEFLPGSGLTSITLLSSADAGLDLQVVDESGDLDVTPRVDLEGEHAPHARLMGAAGVLDVAPHGEDALAARIAPLPSPVPRTLRPLLQRRRPLRVPAADRESFLEVAYPKLRSLTSVTSVDGSVPLPAARRPSLRLTASYASGDRLTLRWSWHYHDPDRVLPIDQRQGAHRDIAHEEAVVAEAMTLWPQAGSETPELLSGPDTALFSEHVLDALDAMDHVETEVVGTRHSYRELDSAPKVRVTQQASPGKHDWFDLGFEITIEGRSIPFPSLFVALARGRSKLLLPDKTYFSLDHPAFDTLRELIREGEALAEWEPERQSLSRFQVEMWNDLEEMADETDASAEWDRTVGRAKELAETSAPALPDALHAELRPYQLEGYSWLAFLFAHGLGGVLADDMGLGKTVQTLALIAHARERAGASGAAGAADAVGAAGAAGAASAPPFLVVAPSSVLPVWRREAERFTPGLDVRVLDRTRAARGADLASEIAGADVVVTSYAVLRIDEEDFAARPFQGFVLDEAQFVKNRRSRTHRAAKGVRADFRLAITGTPMENSLDDLWSILDLVTPGLLGGANGFRQRYTLPIETGEHPDRMELLRRRVRPFLLRRTKELVATELPPKHEEVLTVTLGEEHRAVYDSVLQRERKKVLGILDTDLGRQRFIVFRSLTLLRMMAIDPGLVDAEAYADVPSSKLEALFDRLEEVIGGGHRVLLFSQFTSYLDRVADELSARGIGYAHLDGSTRDRDGAVAGFREGDAPVFLISLKAGGFGLTLTEADYVFLLDPWWNPAAENQAVDRAHRIGQERQVMVYRMVAEDTIEEKVLALQRRKAELFDAFTDGGDAFRSAMTADDIRELLG
ncbi:DEAD/DEAH box helicase [Brachybacterium alimentarium]|uniref:DEAD/DEAH box helicase n=1 Tax=Brachybacterium alimentarium TaxID=47845 RepID=UPI000DF4C210|nr:DEAD/DEAH box helicase [Brachybacterium alimentarium]RCS80233.1 ATP-dependent helicase [Brachybacterium alimentarium]